MSLTCGECDIDVQPSDSLPGREGTFVHPVLPSLFYVVNDGRISYRKGYVEAPHGQCLCLACMGSRIPRERENVLGSIYQAYEAETVFSEIQNRQKGQWCSQGEMNDRYRALKEFEEKMGKIGDGCIFCGKDPEDGGPYFSANVLDRLYGKNSLSGFGSYQFSDIETGMLKFRFCMDDFRKSFPVVFEKLGCALLDKPYEPDKNRPMELYIGDMGEEDADKIVEGMIKKLEKMDDVNVRIVRHSKRKREK